jgi:hypothetical protein
MAKIFYPQNVNKAGIKRVILVIYPTFLYRDLPHHQEVQKNIQEVYSPDPVDNFSEIPPRARTTNKNQPVN